MKRANLECSDEELFELIGQLSLEGSIKSYRLSGPSSFLDFLADFSVSWWVYAILYLTLAEMFLVLYGSSSLILILSRQLLGLALLGFFPGYSTLRLLFPNGKITLLERIVLSIFLSVVVSILSGTILGSALLLDTNSNIIVLTAITISTTLGASYRSFSRMD